VPRAITPPFWTTGSHFSPRWVTELEAELKLLFIYLCSIKSSCSTTGKELFLSFTFETRKRKLVFIYTKQTLLNAFELENK
jgi:hypothetical protein